MFPSAAGSTSTSTDSSRPIATCSARSPLAYSSRSESTADDTPGRTRRLDLRCAGHRNVERRIGAQRVDQHEQHVTAQRGQVAGRNDDHRIGRLRQPGSPADRERLRAGRSPGTGPVARRVRAVPTRRDHRRMRAPANNRHRAAPERPESPSATPSTSIERLGAAHASARPAGEDGTDHVRRRTMPGRSVSGNPGRVELQQERVTALGFVGLADLGGHHPETTQRPQEPTVGGLGPADVTAPPPSVGSQCVESTVISDPIGGVPLDDVTSEIAEFGPPVEIPRR